MAGFGGMRKGRREAVENLGFSEEGDCPRCGGKIPKRGVELRIRSTLPSSHDDRPRAFAPQLASLLVHRSLAVLDVRPFTVTSHVLYLRIEKRDTFYGKFNSLPDVCERIVWKQLCYCYNIHQSLDDDRALLVGTRRPETEFVAQVLDITRLIRFDTLRRTGQTSCEGCDIA